MKSLAYLTRNMFYLLINQPKIEPTIICWLNLLIKSQFFSCFFIQPESWATQDPATGLWVCCKYRRVPGTWPTTTCLTGKPQLCSIIRLFDWITHWFTNPMSPMGKAIGWVNHIQKVVEYPPRLVFNQPKSIKRLQKKLAKATGWVRCYNIIFRKFDRDIVI